jgi:hypothetical protein
VATALTSITVRRRYTTIQQRQLIASISSERKKNKEARQREVEILHDYYLYQEGTNEGTATGRTRTGFLA